MSKTKELSAYQLLQRNQADLKGALQLLVNKQRDLNPAYLDQTLIRSMKSEWPKEQALPLLFSQNQLFVACAEDSPEDLSKILKSLSGNSEIKIIKINQRSWDFVAKGADAGGANNGGKAMAQLGATLAATLEAIPARTISATDENSIGSEVRWV